MTRIHRSKRFPSSTRLLPLEILLNIIRKKMLSRGWNKSFAIILGANDHEIVEVINGLPFGIHKSVGYCRIRNRISHKFNLFIENIFSQMALEQANQFHKLLNSVFSISFPMMLEHEGVVRNVLVKRYTCLRRTEVKGKEKKVFVLIFEIIGFSYPKGFHCEYPQFEDSTMKYKFLAKETEFLHKRTVARIKKILTFTPFQEIIFKLISQNFNEKQIADRLNKPPATIKREKEKVKEKFELTYGDEELGYFQIAQIYQNMAFFKHWA